MKISIETAGGGGVVLLVIVALLAGGHGAPVSAVLVAVLIALAVVVALALGGLVAFLVYRARSASSRTPRSVVHEVVQLPGPSRPRRGSLDHPDGPRAIEAPREIRLPPDQLEQLAEIIRRTQRREQ